MDSLVNGVNVFTNYNPIYKSNTLDSNDKKITEPTQNNKEVVQENKEI